MIKKVFLLTMVLIMCLALAQVYAIDTAGEDGENSIEAISGDNIDPKAEPEHACHSGTEHRKCDLVYYPVPCDCIYATYECCCGRTMGQIFKPCDEHGYKMFDYESMTRMLSEHRDKDSGNVASDENDKWLIEKSNEITDKIKSMQK